MVWLVDEAIRSRGLPGDVGHSDKLILHTKTHTKTHNKTHNKTHTKTHTKKRQLHTHCSDTNI